MVGIANSLLSNGDGVPQFKKVKTILKTNIATMWASTKPHKHHCKKSK